MEVKYLTAALLLMLGCAGPTAGPGVKSNDNRDANPSNDASGEVRGGEAGASEAGIGPGEDPFAAVTLKPDTDTKPVASCAGQPDMTLCSVVTTPDRWYDICVGGACVSPGCGSVSCNAPAPHFPIPANTDHTHFQVQPGAERVVVDLVTGLHWQGCDVGRSGEACDTGASQSLTWKDALAYCNALTWGGKHDWYLPDSYELLSILDWARYGDHGVALDPNIFPHSSNMYWTSHFYSNARVFAIQFAAVGSFAVSTITDNTTAGTLQVRCARRGFSRNAVYVDKRFVATVAGAEKTITDSATGLVWQGCATGYTGPSCKDPTPPGLLTKAEWVTYCESLSWAGFRDWRLPTFKELHSIIRYPPLSGTDLPAIDTATFDVKNGPYLGSRAGWKDSALPMLIEVLGGKRVGPDAKSKFPAVCVRQF